jgi:hypothetical protein
MLQRRHHKFFFLHKTKQGMLKFDLEFGHSMLVNHLTYFTVGCADLPIPVT